MKILLLLLCTIAAAWGGLDEYRELLIADPPDQTIPSRGVRVTYLGTNGYLLESKDATLLVDPYFTRASLFRVALNLRLQSHDGLTRKFSAQSRRIDAILVTHGHFDHLLDVPSIARPTGARVIASSTSVNLVRAMGVSRATSALPHSTHRVGAARIHVLPATHDCVFGRIPFPGTRSTVPPPPRRASDWVCGEPLAFLIEMGGQRIYIDSGGTRGTLPPANIRPVDLAILGVALPDSRARLPEALARLNPRYFLPSHQDNFFRPLRRGFSFGPLTNFPEVRRLSAGERLILMDYFRPWTLR